MSWLAFLQVILIILILWLIFGSFLLLILDRAEVLTKIRYPRKKDAFAERFFGPDAP